MPFPALLIGIAVLTGVVGIGKTAKAASDNSKASDINSSANSIVSDASSKATQARTVSKDSLEKLGQTKIKVISEKVKPFVHIYKKIKNVDFSEVKGIDESGFVLDKEEIADLEKLSEFTTSLLSGSVSGGFAGAATAFGAYSAVGYLGTAGTGAAISGLSGAAATNATLAWLGGGTLASGGLGIAGGTAILGGLVAAPALLVLGCFLGSKASKNLDNAKSNLAQAREYSEQMKTLCSVCDKISKNADFFRSSLEHFNKAIYGCNDCLSTIINKYGTNWLDYPIEEKKNISIIVKNIQAIKALLDTPILNPDGSPSDAASIPEITSKVNRECGSQMLRS